MVSRTLLISVTLVCLLVGGTGLVLFLQQRIASCAYVPLLADNILPNADMGTPGEIADMPQGWSSAAPGVRLGDFAIDGDARALQLIGIANYIQTPAITIRGGQRYCVTGRAITDSEKGSATRLRVAFHWLNAQGEPVSTQHTPWQPVVLWQPEAPPDDWSHIQASFVAPQEAAQLLVRFHPASDDRIYLDAVQVRQGGQALTSDSQTALADIGHSSPGAAALEIMLQPWPHGHHAAISFSFDWETAMGGLVHSRSVGDPYTDVDPELRGMRMREGITTTLALFRPYGIRATYYATGYNFLLGNSAQREFMGNPTYTWASTMNHWTSNHWQTTPWFAPDPYGTVQSHPAWYFGDLIPVLQSEQHDIQSHTFSHFYGGFVTASDWQSDIATWREVAALRNVPAARSLAFPWSSSGGMSDASWEVLEQAGITSITRLSSQSQYSLFARDEQGIVTTPRCRPLPGHERILACPDFYLTPASAALASQQIEQAVAAGGMIDFWAHTEEVVNEEQRAVWEQVVRQVAADERLWVAPLREIADWQQAVAAVTIEEYQYQATADAAASPLTFTIYNAGDHDLDGLTLQLPFAIERIRLQPYQGGEDDQPIPLSCENGTPHCEVTIGAGQKLEVQAWTEAVLHP